MVLIDRRHVVDVQLSDDVCAREGDMKAGGSLYAFKVRPSGSSSISRADEKCVVKACKSSL